MLFYYPPVNLFNGFLFTTLSQAIAVRSNYGENASNIEGTGPYGQYGARIEIINMFVCIGMYGLLYLCIICGLCDSRNPKNP